MSTLKIRLFGEMEVVRDTECLSPFPTRKSRALLAYLSLHCHRFHPREVLANVFWPESSTARKRLRTELWLTRKFLEGVAGEHVLATRNDSVGIHPDAEVRIDVAQFESHLESSAEHGSPLGAEGCRRLEQAAELYRGDLLEGFYEDWCLEARERLRESLLSALGKLMAFYQERRQWSLAIEHGRRILGHEPLSEQVHRDLMRCYFEMGNRVAALRQYRRCADLLMEELGVEPMLETAALSREIKTGQALP